VLVLVLCFDVAVLCHLPQARTTVARAGSHHHQHLWGYYQVLRGRVYAVAGWL
jgi:hypothetical protein